MANPTTRKNLHFFPEDSGPSLSQAWKASRWLHELDSDLTTPMIRIQKQDFYIYEPTLLSNGGVCMPTRWFKRGGKTFARVWKMQENSDTDLNAGWVVEGDTEFEVCESDLVVSFPLLVQSFSARKKSDPRIITGTSAPGILLSTNLTFHITRNPSQQKTNQMDQDKSS